MTVVTEDLGDVESGDAVVTVVLAGEAGERINEAYVDDETIVTSYQFRPDDDGTWTLTLESNDDITPSGTRWRRTVTLRDGHSTFSYGDVPASGTHEWGDILTEAPGAIPTAALDTHLDDTDAHGYGTRLLSISSDVASVSSSVASVSSAVATVSSTVAAVSSTVATVSSTVATVSSTVASVSSSLASATASVSALERKVPIVHVWEDDTWSRFDTQRVVTADGSQSFTLSVTGRRGRFAPTAASGGNHREWRLDSACSFTNSEIRSIWYGQASDTSPCQYGHVHRATLVGGLHKAFVVWSNVAFSILSTLQINGWQANGTSLDQAVGIAHTDVTSIDRQCRIRYARRLNVFDVSQYYASPDDLYGLADSDTVSVVGMGDTSFNLTTRALAGLNGTGFFQLSDTAANDNVDAVANGALRPALQMKRYFPYAIASRLIGDRLEAKRWRPEDPEPDWGHPLACTSVTISTTGSVTQLSSGPGFCGLLLAHGLSGSFGEYGQVTIRELD